MLRKYISLYKYYCKVAPAVWRSRGQQCTGECKYSFLFCGISVIVGSGRNRAFPGHVREGMKKPRERDPTQAMLLCTPRLLYPHIKSRISCLCFPLRPVNLYNQIGLHGQLPSAETLELNLRYLGVFTALRGANLSEVPWDTHATLLCALLKSQEEGQAHLY